MCARVRARAHTRAHTRVLKYMCVVIHMLCGSEYSGMVFSVRDRFIFLTCIFLSYFLAVILESSLLLQC